MKSFCLIFLLITITLLSACGSQKRKGAQIIYNTYENGNNKTVLQYFTDPADFDDSYNLELYYPDGRLKLIGLEQQGIKKGKWRFYFPSGDLKAVVYFKNDTMDGPFTLYGPNGKIKTTGIFKNNLLQNWDTITPSTVRTLQILFQDLNFGYFKNTQERLDTIKQIVDSTTHVTVDSLIFSF